MAQAASERADNDHLTKKQLQQQMEKTRESVAETVSEIKETISNQYDAAKQTVGSVLDYREHFQQEPLVWSLGALSAGFALGYTMGYAHKETKGSRRKTPLSAFADSLVNELSVVGNSLVMPTLNARIKELFGFDFSEVLESIGTTKKNIHPRKRAKKSKSKPRGVKARKKKVV
jgi:hypothetical protein